jgi:hypothetical protein
MFCDAHPSKYGAMSVPPPGVETWIKDIFGDRAKDLLFFMHPHLKRWCLGERHRDPRKGENIYQVIWICAEEAKETEDELSFMVPSDYVGDRFLECFGQFVGEFKLPTRLDFEEIEAGDRKKYGVDAVCEMFQLREDAPLLEREKTFADWEADFWDYYGNAYVDHVNQKYGSGQRMSSYATVGYKCNPNKWHYVQKEGYQIRTRKGTQFNLAVIQEMLEKDFKPLGMMLTGQKRTPEQLAENKADYERLVKQSRSTSTTAKPVSEQEAA